MKLGENGIHDEFMHKNPPMWLFKFSEPLIDCYHKRLTAVVAPKGGITLWSPNHKLWLGDSNLFHIEPRRLGQIYIPLRPEINI